MCVCAQKLCCLPTSPTEPGLAALIETVAVSLKGGGFAAAAGQNQWYHFGVGAPPILVPILLRIGMFTGG